MISKSIVLKTSKTTLTNMMVELLHLDGVFAVFNIRIQLGFADRMFWFKIFLKIYISVTQSELVDTWI